MNDWQSGETLDEDLKETVRKEATSVMCRNSGLCFLYVAVFVVPSLRTAVYEKSYFFLAAVLIFGLCGALAVKHGLQKLSALKENRFQWKTDIVAERMLGGRHSHSRLFGEHGETYYTQHFALGYAKGSHIIGIKYLNEKSNLADRLSHLYDPLAYKIKDGELNGME